MIAIGNRFATLSNEEEIDGDFEGEENSIETSGSDTLLSDGNAPMDDLVLGSSCKKLMAVKVKKHSKLSKKRLASRVVPPTVVDSSLQGTVAVEMPSRRTSSPLWLALFRNLCRKWSRYRVLVIFHQDEEED
jgi:hypothetical protein